MKSSRTSSAGHTRTRREQWRRCTFAAALLAGMLGGCAIGADVQPQRPRMQVMLELPPPVEVAQAKANMVTAVIPGARCAAVSDEHSLLAASTSDQRGVAQLLLMQLDGEGKIREGEPAKIILPLPLALQGFQHYVHALAFHPAKPLLYVWRDARGEGRKDHPAVDVVFNELDHLLIYSIEGGKLSLLKTAAHGRDYSFGVQMGSLAVDAKNGRLYVSNTQVKNRESKDPDLYQDAPGYLQLDDAGMPVADDNGLRLVMRRPPMQRYDGQHRLCVKEYWNFPLGMSGPFPINDNTMVFTDKHDLITVTIDPSRVPAGVPKSFWLPLLEYGQASWCRCSLHPALPVIYVSAGGRLFRIEHVDGFPTLLPQVIGFNDNPTSAPVVCKSMVALGAGNSVLLFPTDAAGYFTGEAQRVAAKTSGSALAYSARYDRLYVAVDP